MAKKKRANKTKLWKELLDSVKRKRAKKMIEHILKHGSITTEELRDQYGYSEPRRAAQDVKDAGIPLISTRVKGASGRSIARYKLGDLSTVRAGRFGGRKTWPKKLKKQLIGRDGSRCVVCLTEYEERYLQIDHRIPFKVGGDPSGKLQPDRFMLLCGSCNRAKSWSCEHCENLIGDKLTDLCRTCYWASPNNYTHVALRLVRRLDVSWSGDEVPKYDQLLRLSKRARQKLPDFVKETLNSVLVDRSL